MIRKLFFAFAFILLTTGFTVEKSPRSFELSVFQHGNDSPSVIVLNDPSHLFESIEQIDMGKFIIHYNPLSCLYRNGFSVSNGGNEVDFPTARSLTPGTWVYGQAILTVTDLQGVYTNGFIAYARIVVYPGSQIVP